MVGQNLIQSIVINRPKEIVTLKIKRMRQVLFILFPLPKMQMSG